MGKSVKSKKKNIGSKDNKEIDLDNIPLVMGLRSTVNKLQNKVSKLKMDVGQQKQFEYDLVQKVDKLNPYIQIYKPSKEKTKKPSVSAVVQFSDWHIGEMIDASETNNLNKYNYKIAQKRIFHITESICKWVQSNRDAYKIDTIHIFDHGDNISGDIHQELTITNEFTVPEQIIMAAYLKAEVYRRFAVHFKNVKVTWVAPDNHSRKTRKPQAKQSGKNSENYLVGFLTRSMLQDVKNVDVNVILSHQAQVIVGNQRYIIEHGNNIRSVMGFPYYGLDRKIGREARVSMSAGGGFDKLIIGHFHVPMNTQFFNINGSLSATSEYDHQSGRHAEPSQVAWMVGSHGEFNWTPFGC